MGEIGRSHFHRLRSHLLSTLTAAARDAFWDFVALGAACRKLQAKVRKQDFILTLSSGFHIDVTITFNGAPMNYPLLIIKL